MAGGMAGGMGRQGGRVSVHERIHGTLAQRESAALVVKHCCACAGHRWGRRGWSVGRVLFPGVLRRTVRRPSISGRRCRRPRAVHPRTRAGSPRACAVRPCSGRGLPSRSGRPDRWWSLAPPFHPYLKQCFRRSVLCGTVPRVAPGGCCPPPCPSEPGPSSTHVVRRAPRPPDQPLRAGHRRARRAGLDRLDQRPTTNAGPTPWGADPALGTVSSW